MGCVRERGPADESPGRACARLEGELANKEIERDRVLALFRKGRIGEADLDRQMDEIEVEETRLRTNIEELSAGLRGVADLAAQMQSTQALLETLRSRIDQGLSWETKRQLIEALVGGIRIDT